MTLLVISPDYASHLLPLVTLAGAWRDAGHEVVVATGPATAPIVTEAGFRRIDLSLGRGANAGVMRTEQQQAEEAASLAGFFAATREGMVETLTYQATERLTDLMWEPVDRARQTLRIIEEVAPDAILVDHLAFSARMALHTAGIPYGDVVLGHPTALPVGDERYGCPPFWPAAFTPEPERVAALRELCERVSTGFTAQWNSAAAQLDPTATPVADAFAVHGETVLYNYPEPLAAGDGRMLPPRVFLGSTLRGEAVPTDVAAWLDDDAPFVYVSFGSFLSVRGDVLARVADALRRLGVRAAIATGATDPAALGDIPDTWLVRDFLPQVRLLQSAAVAVTHGGNNSVTEATAQGVPLVVLPFSTDQFAGAAALERTGVGVALAPNTATVDDLVTALATQLDAPAATREVLAEIRAAERREPGPARAYAALSAR
ncbi:glycosyltransferase [Microbacterium sp. cx-55]|uniref:glycosyltransferase n=1 Tax=Microbacterium sp. cx-55 TaxID=2875948 RepID=UPI001CBB7FBC|nr:glycosyltransferase [Microbacterium sp. cx-55]MBZ4487512.1 glycosyltransferase [Microbacterium sp. cx-55]UGB35532.1 glycosyltransferase [Microbacterium sp. cx-55]